MKIKLIIIFSNVIEKNKFLSIIFNRYSNIHSNIYSKFYFSLNERESIIFSSVIKLIIDRLLLSAQNQNKPEFDDISKGSSMTSLTLSSPRSSFDSSKLIKLKESIKMRDQKQRFDFVVLHYRKFWNRI